MTEAVRYSDVLAVRVTPALSARIGQAAAKHGQKPAEYTRQALRMALELDGFDMTPVVRPAAGTPRWALVTRGERDQIVTIRHADNQPDISDVSYYPRGYVPRDGDAWVPVEDADTEPFNADRHWRLVPPVHEIVSEYDRIDRVRCVYTVVEKSMELA